MKIRKQPASYGPSCYDLPNNNAPGYAEWRLILKQSTQRAPGSVEQNVNATEGASWSVRACLCRMRRECYVRCVLDCARPWSCWIKRKCNVRCILNSARHWLFWIKRKCYVRCILDSAHAWLCWIKRKCNVRCILDSARHWLLWIKRKC